MSLASCSLKRWWFALGAALVAPSAHAEQPSIPLDPEGTLVFDGQYRPRLVVHSGGDFRGDAVSSREVVTQRARLGMTFQQQSGVEVTLRVQDVRIWGEEADTLNDFSADGFDVHEAFGFLPATDWFALRIGRQEIVLDDARLVGNVDFTQRGRSFDGVRGMIELEPLKVDLLYAKVREAESNPDGHVPEDVGDNIDFGGVHVSADVAAGHGVSALYLLNAHTSFNDAGDDHFRHTAGAFAKGAAGGFSYQAEGYYQFGRLAESRIAAYMGAARVGYRFDLPGRPAITAWGEMLSGDGSPEGTFDTLYATNHKFYGEMDFFLVLPRDTALLGLADAGGRLATTLTEDLQANADFHHLRAVESSAGDDVFGNELDLKVEWAAMSKVNVHLLYGIFLPGDAMRARKGYDASVDMTPEHFGYMTLDMKL